MQPAQKNQGHPSDALDFFVAFVYRSVSKNQFETAPFGNLPSRITLRSSPFDREEETRRYICRYPRTDRGKIRSIHSPVLQIRPRPRRCSSPPPNRRDWQRMPCGSAHCSCPPRRLCKTRCSGCNGQSTHTRQRPLHCKREAVSPFSRDAEDDTVKIFKEYDELPGVIHCYAYGTKTAKIALDKGLYLGVGGTSTYTRNAELREVIKMCPIDRILLETDCPYLSPEPVRRETNNSSFITYVIDNICSLKNMSREDIINATNENAYRLFKLGGKR